MLNFSEPYTAANNSFSVWAQFISDLVSDREQYAMDFKLSPWLYERAPPSPYEVASADDIVYMFGL